MRQLLLALALSFTSAMAADSQMFRGHPSLSGVTPPPGKPLEGKIAWSSATMGWELYQPLENMDGQAVFPSTPAVVGGRIYLCAGPYLFVFDAAGQPVYHVKLSACTLASPTVVDGLVYVSTDDGRMHAVEAKDGKERWTAVIGANPFMKQVDNWDVYHSSATVVDGVLYVGSADGRIYALSAANGKELWHFQTGHVVRATPAVVAGRVYCGSFDGKVYALDAATGSKLWEVDTATKGTPWHAVQGSCAVVDGTVYVGSRSGFLYAIDAATGKVRWQESHDGNWVPSSPAVRDGIAYVGRLTDTKSLRFRRTARCSGALTPRTRPSPHPCWPGTFCMWPATTTTTSRARAACAPSRPRPGKSSGNWSCPPACGLRPCWWTARSTPPAPTASCTRSGRRRRTGRRGFTVWRNIRTLWPASACPRTRARPRCLHPTP